MGGAGSIQEAAAIHRFCFYYVGTDDWNTCFSNIVSDRHLTITKLKRARENVENPCALQCWTSDSRHRLAGCGYADQGMTLKLRISPGLFAYCTSSFSSHASHLEIISLFFCTQVHPVRLLICHRALSHSCMPSNLCIVTAASFSYSSIEPKATIRSDSPCTSVRCMLRTCTPSPSRTSHQPPPAVAITTWPHHGPSRALARKTSRNRGRWPNLLTRRRSRCRPTSSHR